MTKDTIHDRAPGFVRVIALAAFVLAFVLRAYWVFKIQSPYGTLYNDMIGYSERARFLESEWGPRPERIYTFFPYGGHYYYRLEYLLAGGYTRERAVCLLQALTGALAVPPLVFMGARLVRSRLVLIALAVATTIWAPQIAFLGFFTSETPYILCFTLASWVTVRLLDTGKGGFWVGLLSGCAFAVRPQYLLTCLLALPLVYLFHRKRRKALRTAFVAFALPFALIVTYSSVRFHKITGRYGLISENGPFQRILGDTTIGLITSHWTEPDGRRYNYGFSPPSKFPAGETERFDFEGYIADPDILEAERKKRMRGVPLFKRAKRMVGNARILFEGKPLWPESNHATAGLRRHLQVNFRFFVRDGLAPLALLGAVLSAIFARFRSRRFALTAYVAVANCLTMLVAAALYYGEARYRVPYDSFLLLLGAVSVDFALFAPLGWVERRFARWRSVRVSASA